MTSTAPGTQVLPIRKIHLSYKARQQRTGLDHYCAGELHEVESPIILQPGRAALTDGSMRCTSSSRGWAAGAGTDRHVPNSRLAHWGAAA